MRSSGSSSGSDKVARRRARWPARKEDAAAAATARAISHAARFPASRSSFCVQLHVCSCLVLTLAVVAAAYCERRARSSHTSRACVRASSGACAPRRQTRVAFISAAHIVCVCALRIIHMRIYKANTLTVAMCARLSFCGSFLRARPFAKTTTTTTTTQLSRLIDYAAPCLDCARVYACMRVSHAAH